MKRLESCAPRSPRMGKCARTSTPSNRAPSARAREGGGQGEDKEREAIGEKMRSGRKRVGVRGFGGAVEARPAGVGECDQSGGAASEVLLPCPR